MANRPSLDEIFGNTPVSQQNSVSSKPPLEEIFAESRVLSSVPTTESGISTKDIGQISGGIIGGSIS